MSKKVFVTGASGFIAKHILRDLLDTGYEVRGSLRNMNRADEVRETLLKHVKDPESVNNRLEFAELDLNRDDGWEAALQNTTALLHTASPFPLAQPKNEDDVIRPAVEGTQRALSAALASGLKRVILTSSTVAITNRKLPDGQNAYNENDWTDVDSATATPYAKSKTLAERAAWDFVAEHPEMQLTTINPGMVYGPPLDQQFGTSVQTIKRFLQARDPMLPRFGLPIVDVRDVSRMHIRALEVPESIGRRLLCADGFAWYSEVGKWLREAYPQHRISRHEAPNWIVRMLATFDKDIAATVPALGREQRIDNMATRDILGFEFTPMRESVIATAEYLISNDLVHN